MKVWPIDPLEEKVVKTIYSPVYNHFFYTRGVRKVTIGITGLWRPRVQIDVAF